MEGKEATNGKILMEEEDDKKVKIWPDITGHKHSNNATRIQLTIFGIIHG